MFLAVNATACPPPTRLGPDRDLAPQISPGSAAVPESLAAAPTAQWTRSVGRAIRGTPAIGREVVAVGTVDHTVVLLERETGTVLWRSRLSGTIRGGPLLRDARLYVATERTPASHVYALNLRDGRTAWRQPAGGISAPLVLDGDALYAVTEQGTALRLAARDGAVVWQRRLGGGIRAAPVLTPAGVAITTTGDSLYLLDPATGAVRASRATPGTVLGTPATDGRHLFLATVRGVVLAVTTEALESAWEFTLPDAVYGAAVLAADTLLVVARDGTLTLVPVGAPDSRRTLSLGRPVVAGPTVTTAGVLVGTVAGEVLCVDPATGAVRWQAKIAGPIESPPAVREGRLVLVDGRGGVHVYR